MYAATVCRVGMAGEEFAVPLMRSCFGNPGGIVVRHLDLSMTEVLSRGGQRRMRPNLLMVNRGFTQRVQGSTFISTPAVLCPTRKISALDHGTVPR